MFQDSYAERTPEHVSREFGGPFAAALFEIEPGAWSGPIESGYGWHLVFVEALEPGRIPEYEEVENEVRIAWQAMQREQFKRDAYDALRAKYTVVLPDAQAVRDGS